MEDPELASRAQRAVQMARLRSLLRLPATRGAEPLRSAGVDSPAAPRGLASILADPIHHQHFHAYLAMHGQGDAVAFIDAAAAFRSAPKLASCVRRVGPEMGSAGEEGVWGAGEACARESRGWREQRNAAEVCESLERGGEVFGAQCEDGVRCI
jgi:hypothetical protein